MYWDNPEGLVQMILKDLENNQKASRPINEEIQVEIVTAEEEEKQNEVMP